LYNTVLLHSPGPCSALCIGLKRKTNWLLSGGMGWQVYGPRCVVGLLLVVPPSDWLWCGQVRISKDCALQVSQPPLSCPLSVHSLWRLKSRLLGRSSSRPAFALNRSPLQPRLDPRFLFCGSAFGSTLVAMHRALAPASQRCLFHALHLCRGIFRLHPASSYAPGPKCLGFCSGGPLSPASELGAGGILGHIRCSAHNQGCSFSFARTNAQGFIRSPLHWRLWLFKTDRVSEVTKEGR
jgi:hypothetical protein